MSNNTLDEVRGLIETALYDTGYETVERAFVDSIIPHAQVAIASLAARFRQGGLGESEAALLRAAVSAPGAPRSAAVKLLAGLKEWARPLIESLLADPEPAFRALGVAAAGAAFEPERWLPALADPEPAVRRAAVETLIEQRARLPEAPEILRRALADPDASVRLAAMKTTHLYHDIKRNEILAHSYDAEPDPELRRAILFSLAAAARQPEWVPPESPHSGPALRRYRLSPAMGDLLLRELHSEDAVLRRTAVTALKQYPGEQVAAPLVERLLIEPNQEIQTSLLEYGGYRVIQNRLLPYLQGLIASPTPVNLRRAIVRALHSLSFAGIPLLITLMHDPEVGQLAREALEKRATTWSLPGLLQGLANPAHHALRPTLRALVEQIVNPMRWYELPARPVPRVQAMIEERIAALQPEQLRFRGATFPALPLYRTPTTRWALRSDGLLLRMSQGGPRLTIREEKHALTRFAVMVQGQCHYEELTFLLPKPPYRITLCAACDGRGAIDAPETPCPRCNGLGWRVPR